MGSMVRDFSLLIPMQAAPVDVGKVSPSNEPKTELQKQLQRAAFFVSGLKIYLIGDPIF
jgi:hypothetical protein